MLVFALISRYMSKYGLLLVGYRLLYPAKALRYSHFSSLLYFILWNEVKVFGASFPSKNRYLSNCSSSERLLTTILRIVLFDHSSRLGFPALIQASCSSFDMGFACCHSSKDISPIFGEWVTVPGSKPLTHDRSVHRQFRISAARRARSLTNCSKSACFRAKSIDACLFRG